MNDGKLNSLYQLLLATDLTEYHEKFISQLKVTSADHIKYVTESDLLDLGMTKPERRRFIGYRDKLFPSSVVGKLKKKMMNAINKDGSSRCINEKSEERTCTYPEQHIIPAEHVILCRQLGDGEFGRVWQGVWKTSISGRVQVAVKCVSAAKMAANTLNFVQEAAIMHKIRHDCIVKFYGVVLEPKNVMLVTELAPLRSLLECLKQTHAKVNFDVLRLCDFAEQICHGMAYLENNRLIHRDLAARNILVYSIEKVKISDFGLSRALGSGEDYYRGTFSGSVRLPIAWCSPESIKFLKFTSASDVWSFGVTLWECFTYGFQPWAGMTGRQILEAIDSPNGQRLEIPDDCPIDYYNVMLQTWQFDASSRPKFTDLCELLPEIRPETLKAVVGCSDGQPDHLQFSSGNLILVINKRPREYPDGYYWKGVVLRENQYDYGTNCGRTGLFSPSSTVAHLTFGQQGRRSCSDHQNSGVATFPNDSSTVSSSVSNSYSNSSSVCDVNKSSSIDMKSKKATTTTRKTLGNLGAHLRGSFSRNQPSKTSKLHRSDISCPQNDFRHMGHVGANGEHFGDFIGPDKQALPIQVVAPLKKEAGFNIKESLNSNNAGLSRFPCEHHSIPPPLAPRSKTSQIGTVSNSIDAQELNALAIKPIRSMCDDSVSLLDEVFDALKTWDSFSPAHDNSKTSIIQTTIDLDSAYNDSSLSSSNQRSLSPTVICQIKKPSMIKSLSYAESRELDELTELASKYCDKILERDKIKFERKTNLEQHEHSSTSCLLDPLLRLASSTKMKVDHHHHHQQPSSTSCVVSVKPFCDALPLSSAVDVTGSLGDEARTVYERLVDGKCSPTITTTATTTTTTMMNMAANVGDCVDDVDERYLRKTTSCDVMSLTDNNNDNFDDDHSTVENDENPLRMLRNDPATIARSFQRSSIGRRRLAPSTAGHQITNIIDAFENNRGGVNNSNNNNNNINDNDFVKQSTTIHPPVPPPKPRHVICDVEKHELRLLKSPVLPSKSIENSDFNN